MASLVRPTHPTSTSYDAANLTQREGGAMRSRSLTLFAVALFAAAACSSTTSSHSAAPSDSAAPAAPIASAAPATSTPAPTPGPTPTPQPTPATTKFTLMEFNIEYGGDEVDFTKVIEAIQKANPDVVALEEAEGNTQKVAEALGWPYFSVRSQLVSRLPLIDPPEAHGRYEYVEIRPGRVVAISNVHLPSDPYGPYGVRDGKSVAEVINLERVTRMPMLQERLDVLPDLVERGIPTFLTGDFNAPSHLDWTAATVGLRPQIRYPVPWPVSTAIEAAGFRDSYRQLHPDPVADPGLTWWAGRPLIDGYPDPSEPQDRIDIIYAAGPSATDDFRIVGEAGGPQVDIAVSPWGTDHRGVVGTFTVTPGDPPPFVSVDRRLLTLGDMTPARIHTTGSTGERVEVRPTGSTGDPIYSVGIGASSDATMELDSKRLGIGDYEVRLLGPGGIVSAVAPFFVVAAGTKPTLTVDAATYKSGAPITASWRDAPGSRWDWIGIYARGADPLVDSYLCYVYTGQDVAGSVVIDERAHGDWPLPPGAYDAHYLLDDGYASLASAPFTVTK